MTMLQSPDSLSCSEGLGVVVIGRNEGERLVACLTSLARVGAPIVYVDSGSTDGSVAAAERAGATVVRLDMAQPFTAARARNAGYAALKAHYPQLRLVQFIDGDCELDGGWLDVALAFLRDHDDVVVVCGRRRERRPEQSVYNRLCDIEWNTPIGEAAACGGDAVVRADAFETVGGFDSSLIAGEEPELCARLRRRGWKIWRLDAEMTRHDAAMTRFGQWWRRSVRGGYGYVQSSTAQSPGLWGMQIARALAWTALAPAAAIAGLLLHPAAFAGLAIYPLQLLRLARRRGLFERQSWTYAAFMMIAKFAEAQGILTYIFVGRTRGRAGQFEYKGTGRQPAR